MEYLEIILKDIKTKYIDEIFFNYLQFSLEDIISSHFFDNGINKDVEYKDIKKFKDYFIKPGTCNIYLKKILLGTELKNVIVLVSANKHKGDITINFDVKDIEKCDNIELSAKCIKLYFKLLEIYASRFIDRIILGYEPAEDDDMKLISINADKTNLFNINKFNNRFSIVLHNIIKNKNIY